MECPISCVATARKLLGVQNEPSPLSKLMSPETATLCALPAAAGYQAPARMLEPDGRPSMKPPLIRIMADEPTPMAPPSSDTRTKLMFATLDQAANACVRTAS